MVDVCAGGEGELDCVWGVVGCCPEESGGVVVEDILAVELVVEEGVEGAIGLAEGIEVCWAVEEVGYVDNEFLGERGEGRGRWTRVHGVVDAGRTMGVYLVRRWRFFVLNLLIDCT